MWLILEVWLYYCVWPDCQVIKCCKSVAWFVMCNSVELPCVTVQFSNIIMVNWNHLWLWWLVGVILGNHMIYWYHPLVARGAISSMRLVDHKPQRPELLLQFARWSPTTLWLSYNHVTKHDSITVFAARIFYYCNIITCIIQIISTKQTSPLLIY